jgi:methionine synthase II (cobalamin-independent)
MPPFRAEHMGSLLRPQRLLDVREAIREKNLTPEDAGLPAVEEEAIEHVVKLQQELGLKAVTSGEYNRTRFWGLMWDEFEGTVRLQDAEASMFRLYHPDGMFYTEICPSDVGKAAVAAKRKWLTLLG